MRTLVAALSLFVLSMVSRAGDVFDMGESKTVPDWAVGPLLVVSPERLERGGLRVPKKETKRIGTLQANFLELSGKRYKLDSIRLSEIPNSSKICKIKTPVEDGSYLDIQLSQSFSDQTFYYLYIEKIDSTTGKATEAKQYVVWDIKSR